MFDLVWASAVRMAVYSSAALMAVFASYFIGFYRCVAEKDHANQTVDGGDRAEYRDDLHGSRNGSSLLGSGLD